VRVFSFKIHILLQILLQIWWFWIPFLPKY